MAGNSSIEWTEATWNPVVGCSILSPGCINCYAMDEAARQIRCAAGLGRETHYAGTVKTVKGKAVWTGKLALAPDSILLQPLKRKKPTVYFVNSMGDLFHEDCPDEWIDKVFAVMALAPQHTFQVLTKRAKRMRVYMDRLFGSKIAPRGIVCPPWSMLLNRVERSWMAANPNYMADIRPLLLTGLQDRTLPMGPLPNVWLGASTERQQEADERIPHLLQTPAAVRFISAEPLLGSIQLHPLGCGTNALTSSTGPNLDWVIVGGESGTNARPMHPDWARSLRDHCAAAGVAFFFKQWGAYQPKFPQYADEFGMEETDMLCDGYDFPAEGVLYRNGHFYDGVEYQPHTGVGAYWVSRVGKKAAGRLLDGIEHNGMPEIAR